MRNFIDAVQDEDDILNERTHSMRTGKNEEVVAIEGPNGQQLDVALERYKSLRGLIDDEGKLFIWDAMKMTHFQAEMQLGSRIDIGLYLQRRADGRVGCRWDDYSGEGNTPEQNPAFARMTRRADVVVAQSDQAFE
jgi:hypothetical protein